MQTKYHQVEIKESIKNQRKKNHPHFQDKYEQTQKRNACKVIISSPMKY